METPACIGVRERLGDHLLTGNECLQSIKHPESIAAVLVRRHPLPLGWWSSKNNLRQKCKTQPDCLMKREHWDELTTRCSPTRRARTTPVPGTTFPMAASCRVALRTCCQRALHRGGSGRDGLGPGYRHLLRDWGSGRCRGRTLAAGGPTPPGTAHRAPAGRPAESRRTSRLRPWKKGRRGAEPAALAAGRRSC